MKQNFKENLNKVVCDILERTAFLFPEPADLSNGITFDNYELVMATLSYRGDKEGDVTLIVPKELCMELASNLLGEDIDEDDPGEKPYDAVKEILNIIAGQLLIEIYGEKALFTLTSPKVRDLDKETFFSIIENQDYALAVADDYPIITIMKTREEVDEHQSSCS